MEKNYYKEFIDFLKRHNLFNKEAIEYLQKNAFFFNYLEEEYRMELFRMQLELSL